MLDHARHVPLQSLPWSADKARSAIDEIVSDALTGFDEKRFWPAHPLEEGLSDGDASFYFGATGVLWALEYLRRVGATRARIDFRPVLPRPDVANQRKFTGGKTEEHIGQGA